VTHGLGSEEETGECSGWPVPFTLPRNMVLLLPTIKADAHTSAASSRRPRRFKWTRPFRRKTKSGFCACAITFQLACTREHVLEPKFSSVRTKAFLLPVTWLQYWAWQLVLYQFRINTYCEIRQRVGV